MDLFLERFAASSLNWAMGLILLLSVIYALRAFVGYKTVASDARDDFVYKKSQNMVSSKLSEAGYIRAYKRVHNPRSHAHVAFATAVMAVFTLPAMGLLNGLTVLLWEWGGRDEAFTPGFLVHALLMLFLTIGFWALIAYVTARHYHKNTPLSFTDEMQREIDIP